MKIIHYYRKNQFGNEREFVSQENQQDGELIRRLTLQKTITPQIRDAITELSGGEVKFEQVIAP